MRGLRVEENKGKELGCKGGGFERERETERPKYELSEILGQIVVSFELISKKKKKNYVHRYSNSTIFFFGPSLRSNNSNKL